jgi:hypothetical protein
MRWTEEQLADYVARNGKPSFTPNVADTSNPPFKPPGNEAGRFALGRLPVGTMNKTEAAYDAHLWEQRHAGVVLWHKFEAVKLRLADKTFYTPDFMVLMSDGYVQMHEIKGFMEEDANVKIKVAAQMYPFKFIVVRRKKGAWQFEEKS